MAAVGTLVFRLLSAWRRSLWVLPALVVLAGIVAAGVLVFVDPGTSALQALAPRLFTVSPDGARGVLTAIATSMLSVAGVVFSITIATLSLTSQQFTSRVLRTFVRDRGNQLVLGVFLGVFAYCLVVLRAVRSPADGEGYVPQLAVLVGIVLALVGVAFLIYFIDHVAGSIQASTIISRIAAETMQVLRERAGDLDGPPPGALLGSAGSGSVTVQTEADGYVREVDLRSLGELASQRHWRVQVLPTLGDFVAAGDDLLRVSSDSGESFALEEEPSAELRAAVRQAPSSEIYADPAFGVRQLVDIALKALSPGVNDVTTATTCIDYLGAVMIVAGEHPGSSVVWTDDHDEARVLLRHRGFDELIGQAFDQIRENAGAQVAPLLHLLDALERLAGREHTALRRDLLTVQVRRLKETARRGLTAPHEIGLVESRAAAVLALLRIQG